MIRYAALPLALLAAAGCGCEKDPYDVSPEEGKAAAAKVRPRIPEGVTLNPDKPTQIKLKAPPGGGVAPGGGDTLKLPPGAVPLVSDDPKLPVK